MARAAVLLADRLVTESTRADVVVMLDADDPKVASARRHGITLAPGARLTGGTERETAMNAMSDAGFEVIAMTSNAHLGDDDRVTIHQWVSE